MAWPTPSDFQEAVQTPRLSFGDAELQQSLPESDRLGLPRAISGNFAVVFPMVSGSKRWAVRCFTTYHPDQEQRYAAISTYLQRQALPFMVDFRFLRDGIRVRGRWYPILKMEWIEGETLNRYVETHLGDPQALRGMGQHFLDLACALRQRGIAHGDLQHGNILVTRGSLRLIDYDGMYVPGLDGMSSHELGHRNYQHPQRTELDFGPSTDVFSAWSIYLSLLVLSVAPSLWQLTGAGDESLLFCRADYEHPSASATLRALKLLGNPTASAAASMLHSIAQLPIGQLPALDPVQPLPVNVPVRPAAGAPDWLADYVPGITGLPGPSTASVSTVVDPLPARLPAQPRTAAVPKIDGSFRLERCLAVLGLLACVTAVALGFLGITTMLGSSALPAALLTLLYAAFAARYRSLPEAQEKRKLQRRWRTLNTETKRLKAAAGRVADEHRRQEAGEAAEVAQRLRDFQDAFRREGLSGVALTAASVYGIGPELARRLHSAGVRTAADVAYRRVRNVRGIGEMRASALVSWRRLCEADVMARVPRALPPAVAAAIRRGYQNRLHMLERERLEKERDLGKHIQLLTEAKSELEPFKDVTFACYVRRVFSK